MYNYKQFQNVCIAYFAALKSLVFLAGGNSRNSPYFVPEPDNWHLTEDAPDDLKKEFEKYMRETDESTVI